MSAFQMNKQLHSVMFIWLTRRLDFHESALTQN